MRAARFRSRPQRWNQRRARAFGLGGERHGSHRAFFHRDGGQRIYGADCQHRLADNQVERGHALGQSAGIRLPRSKRRYPQQFKPAVHACFQRGGHHFANRWAPSPLAESGRRSGVIAADHLAARSSAPSATTASTSIAQPAPKA